MEKLCLFWRTVLLLFNFIVLLRAYSTSNLPECSSCANRADVSCQIQRMHYPCYHREFRSRWPGKPKELRASQVNLDDKSWIANFTWKPPYDASITSLSGFMLSVNLIQHPGYSSPIVNDPLCYYANLTGTNWDTVKHPHSHFIFNVSQLPTMWLVFMNLKYLRSCGYTSPAAQSRCHECHKLRYFKSMNTSQQSVVFHFDCIQGSIKTDIHIMVMSSPMPNQNPDHQEAKLMLDVPSEVHDVMTINHTIHGMDVHVTFSPARSKVVYHIVCLSSAQSDYRDCYRRINLSQGIHDVIFENVKPDNYSIMIQRSGDNDLYFASKYFPVNSIVPHVKGSSMSNMTIVIITVVTVLIITTATSVAFCMARKRSSHSMSCLQLCKHGHYQQTPQIPPNNSNDQNLKDTKTFYALYARESDSYVKAVQHFCTWLSSSSSSLVDANTVCDTQDQIQPLLAKCLLATQPTHIVVFLSQLMVPLLSETSDLSCDIQNEDNENAQILFLKKAIQIIKDKGISNVNVSLCPTVSNKSQSIQDTDMAVFYPIKRENGDQVIIDTSQITLLINELIPNTSSPHLSFLVDGQMEQVLQSINCVPHSIWNNSYTNIEVSYKSDTTGYGTDVELGQVHTMAYHHEPSFRHPLNQPNHFISGDGTENVTCYPVDRSANPYRSDRTSDWAATQHQIHVPVQPITQQHCRHIHGPSHYSSQNPDYDDHFDSASVCHDGFNRAREITPATSSLYRVTPHDRPVSNKGAEWSPPDNSDNESETYSTVDNQLNEVNRNYMEHFRTK